MCDAQVCSHKDAAPALPARGKGSELGYNKNSAGELVESPPAEVTIVFRSKEPAGSCLLNSLLLGYLLLANTSTPYQFARRG